MKKKNFTIRIVMISVIAVFSCSLQAMESTHGISIDYANKTITLIGEKNPIKTWVDGTQVVELGSFTTENTNFPWDNFRFEEYKVVLENINIHTYLSIRCLNWFIAYGFKIIINSNSYISLGALEEFIKGAPKRHPSAFADLISVAGCPDEGGYSGMGRSDRVKSLLMEKGYTFTARDRR